MNPTDKDAFKILIVDDNPKNIQLVGQLLSREGYPTAFALSGAEALDMAEADRFDLILLDVMMPQMDGYEVCRRLKSRKTTGDTPIIFLTAKTDADSIVKGFESGAHDYVTKPFIAKELLARVKNQLHIKRLNDSLAARYEKIKELEIMRESLTHMIIHDLKNPLGGITGFAELLKRNPAVRADEKAAGHVTVILNSVRIMMDMIMAILDVSRMESNQMRTHMESFSVKDAIDEVVDGFDPLLHPVGIEIEKRMDGGLSIYSDREIVRRIMVNIIGNAINFSPPGSRITVSAKRDSGRVRIEIGDRGPGIPEHLCGEIFDKFKQVRLRQSRIKYSTGLGLTFCKLAVESLGGSIGARPRPEGGTTFWFVLPEKPERNERKAS